MNFELCVGEQSTGVKIVRRGPDSLEVTVEGQTFVIEALRTGSSTLLRVGEQVVEVDYGLGRSHLGGYSARLVPEAAARATATGPGQSRGLSSPMPGRVVRVLCAAGEDVVPGQPLIVLEAMKMENELLATAHATIEEVLVEEGAALEAGVTLLRLKQR